MSYTNEVHEILETKYGFNATLLTGWYVAPTIAEGEKANLPPKKTAKNVAKILDFIDKH